MTNPDKFLVSPALEDAFHSFASSRRAVDLALQAVLDTAMNAAAKQHEKLNKTLEEWWKAAEIHYGVDFTAAPYRVQIKDNKMWIVLSDTDTDDPEQVYRSRLDS